MDKSAQNDSSVKDYGEPFASTPELLEKIASIGYGNPIDGRLDFSTMINTGA